MRDEVSAEVPADALRFQLLGPVRVWRGGRELDLGFPQQRALLALLLAGTGRTVPTGEILDVLWAERPPASAVHVTRRYAAALRRLLEPGLPPRAPGRRMPRRADGYLLAAETDEVDLLRFRELTRCGRRAAATGRSAQAAEQFTLALAEWRGPVAMGIPEHARAHVQFTAVQRELLDTARLAADAALLSGRAEQVLPALRHAAAQDPLDEPLHARLVLALAACDLRADALRAYDEIRHRLATELSLTPGPELAAAHTRTLRQDPPRPAPSPPASDRLPPLPAVFTGREAELRDLTHLADDGAALVCGMPGVGKTALALHWAHRTADRFPDGRLHVDLRGTHPDRPPAQPGEALRTLLTALGVPAHRMPDGTAALSGLYRTLLTGRRVLVLLDDATDTGQLRPLLPAAPGCLALITSRDALPGLLATGAGVLRLEPPPADEARAMLAAHLAAHHRTAGPEDIARTADRCGRLPAALAAVAARPGPGAPHDELRALFLPSYRRLPADAARLLRTLAGLPGSPCTPDAVARSAGLPVRDARRLLAHLADAHLLGEPEPGRYTLHKLLRAFAGDLGDTGGV